MEETKERIVKIHPVFDGKAKFKTGYIPLTGGSIYCQPDKEK